MCHLPSLYLRTPSYSTLRVFGCLCYHHLPSASIHKLATRFTPCVFLDYPSNHRGYVCLELSTRKLIISRQLISTKPCSHTAPYSNPLPRPILFLTLTPPLTFNTTSTPRQPHALKAPLFQLPYGFIPVVLAIHPPPHLIPRHRPPPSTTNRSLDFPTTPVSPTMSPATSPDTLLTSPSPQMRTQLQHDIVKLRTIIDLCTTVTPSPLHKSPIIALHDPNWTELCATNTMLV